MSILVEKKSWTFTFQIGIEPKVIAMQMEFVRLAGLAVFAGLAAFERRVERKGSA